MLGKTVNFVREEKRREEKPRDVTIEFEINGDLTTTKAEHSVVKADQWIERAVRSLKEGPNAYYSTLCYH